MATASSGFQPRTTPAERRAFFDLKRQLGEANGSVDDLKAYIDDRLTRIHYGIANDVTTAGTGISIAASLTLPARPITGYAMISCFLRMEKSVPGDAFSVDIYAVSDGVTTIQDWPCISGVTQYTCTMQTVWTVQPGAPRTFQTRIQRASGTGTCHVYSNFAYNRLDAVWAPA